MTNAFLLVRGMHELERCVADHHVRYHRAEEPQNTEFGETVFNITTAGSSATAPVPAPKQRLARLPDHLQPIRVEPTQPLLCPMPGCAVPLDANDYVWRAHYKRQHHDDANQRHEIELLPNPVLPGRGNAVFRPSDLPGDLVDLSIAVEGEG